jgi:hypothetical protein
LSLNAGDMVNVGPCMAAWLQQSYLSKQHCNRGAE